MRHGSVFLLWVLVSGNVLFLTEAVLKISFVEDLCYNAKYSVIDLKYDSTGILMSAPSLNAEGSFECEVTLAPPKGSGVVLSIFKYDLYGEDQLIIEDSDRHRIALMGYGIFKDEKKAIISDGKIFINYKTDNRTSENRRAGFQFTYTKVMNSPCSSNEFKCNNGKCVLKELICDGHNHCGDRSDQKKCDSIRKEPKEDSNFPEQKLRQPLALWISLIGIACIIVLIVIVVSVVVLVRRAKLKKANNGSSPANTRNDVPLHTVAQTVPSTTVPNNAPQVSNTNVPDSFYNRVRRSMRGARSEPRVENVPKERSAPTQSNMYPSLDQIPTAPNMYGVENPDFQMEE